MSVERDRGRDVAAAAGDDGWRMLFWTAFARSANPMTLMTSDWRYVAVNRAYTFLTSYAREDLVGRSAELVLAPEELRSLDREWRELERVGHVEGERMIVTADGEWVPVQYARRSVDIDGQRLVLSVVIAASDDPVRARASPNWQASLLSPRELEIVGHVAGGERAREIAEDLGIAESTVKTHLRNAMRKVGAKSQAQLVALVYCAQIPQAAIPRAALPT
jgi:PAS domain S-box-containing protein